jgi:hypothetical protein
MTLNLSSSRIVIVIRSVAAIEAPRTGFPPAKAYDGTKSGHYNLVATGLRARTGVASNMGLLACKAYLLDPEWCGFVPKGTQRLCLGGEPAYGLRDRRICGEPFQHGVEHRQQPSPQPRFNRSGHQQAGQQAERQP